MTVAHPCPDDAGGRSGPVALPLATERHRRRQGLTCLYRCGNACAHDEPNASENEYFGDVLARSLSRRGVLRAGAVLTIAAGASTTLACTADAGTAVPDESVVRPPRGLDYETVPANTTDAITVPPGYRSNVVIRWGDPVVPGAPAFDFENQTAEAQAGQFGYNNDFCSLVPLSGPGERYVMFNNHEYTIEPLMFRGYDAENPTDEQIRIGFAAHGLSVVVVERDGSSGQMTAVLDETYNRRYTATSEFVLDGPAAGSDLLKTSGDGSGSVVLGTLNNCAGRHHALGNVSVGRGERQPVLRERRRRRRQRGEGARGPLRHHEGRIRAQVGAARAAFRHDEGAQRAQPVRLGRRGRPVRPTAPPVKHTALGRFKHEGATVRLDGDGRAVAYMGDDERFEYVYKFVSDDKMMRGESRRAREYNRTLLTKGTLYVAKFTGDSPAAEIDGSGKLPADGAFDGGGEWVKLAAGDQSFVDGMTAEEVYVFTRLAADKVGATKMDRPEDVEANPRTGSVYIALTNNSDRGKAGATRTAPADEPNPRNSNKHGHAIELVEARNDPTAATFGWSILLLCGDPDDPSTYFGGFDKSQVSPITSPDNVAFDGHGNLWIATDSGQALGINDGLYGVSLEGPTRGRTTLFASVPRGAECCGPVITDDFVLISPQHPGDLDDASPETPK
jgi:secreted PhoX family phosphatase